MVLHSSNRSLGDEDHRQKDHQASVEEAALEEVPLLAEAGVLGQL